MDSVIQAFDNILNTSPGERIFNPTFGIDLESYLGELMSKATAKRILVELVQGIPSMDSRIVLQTRKCRVVPDYENHTYNITLVAYIRGLENQVFEYSGVLQK